MTGDRLNYLNVALMAASYFLACACPIELLVVSYAVLGPLHYLTEIPWLHKRSYFVEQGAGRQTCLLWGLAAASLFSFLGGARIFACCTFIAIGFALCLVAIKSTWLRMLVLLLLISISAPLTSVKACYLLFGTFLTTLIHVFVFTWQFVLFGCLKERRLSGFISLGVFTLFAVTILIGPDHLHGMHVTAVPFLQNAKAAFGSLPRLLSDALCLGHSASACLAATKFIAFAYTYHYLNWLSKTRVIKWHELSPRALVVVAFLYAGSLLVYAIDYTVGLKVLFFLSIGHVYLEFPLNWRSTYGIAGELRKLCRPSAASGAQLQPLRAPIAVIAVK